MDIATFRRTLGEAEPPRDLAPALAALWWAGKGDWDRAHMIVMDIDSHDAAHVHGYLHRVEGDLDNARYWYRTARRTPATGPLDEEWNAIVTELLARG